MRALPWAFDSAPYFAALVASSCSTRLNGTTEEGATLKGLPAISMAPVPANGADDATGQLGEIRRLVLRQEIVSGGERQHAALEGLHELRRGLPALRRLRGDRQHRRKQVLQTVLHLAEDQTIAFRREVALEGQGRQPGADRLDFLGPRRGRRGREGDEEAAQGAAVRRTSPDAT